MAMGIPVSAAVREVARASAVAEGDVQVHPAPALGAVAVCSQDAPAPIPGAVAVCSRDAPAPALVAAEVWGH